jgi:hypothetical protein
MAYVDPIITLPMTLQDACDALGYQTNDVGDLLRNADVNKWARYKPVEFYAGGPYGFAINETQRRSVNYGITDIPYWTSRMLGNMLNFWFGVDTSSANYPEIGLKAAYWNYLRPTTAFRLSDLLEDPSNPNSRAYFNRAKPPLGNISASQVEISPGGHITFEFEKNEEGVSAGLTVKYEDLQMGGYSVYNMYFGFALWNKSTASPKFFSLTQNSPMSSFQAMGASVHTYIDDETMEGDYRIFPFASSDSIKGTQVQDYQELFRMTTATNIRSNFIALEDWQDVHISIRWADVKVTSLTSYIDQSHTNIIRNIFVIRNNMTDYPVTITKMTLEYIKADYTVDYTQNLITPINLNSGSSYSGTADHNFGQAGASHIKTVRMTIVTLEGVVFYHSADSVKIATVGTGPTPDA